MEVSPDQAPPNEPLINVIDPGGELVSIPQSQVHEAVNNQGFQQASQDDIQKFVRSQKYGSISQRGITALEGAAEGIAGPLATATESAVGIPKEDILGRKEENPWSHGLGQGAGLVGSLATGVGEGALLEHAGVEGAAALGLGAEKAGSEAVQAAKLVAEEAGQLAPEAAALQAAKASALSPFGTVEKIGSTAAKMAIENMVIGGTDEVSKLILQDPNQSVETAAANIGLSGIIGGVFGAGIGSLSPLWKATAGPRVQQVLQHLADKSGGIDNVISDPINNALEIIGAKDIAPEVRSALSDNPEIVEAAKTLQQSDTTRAGKAFQEAHQNFRNSVGKALSESFGYSPEQVEALELKPSATFGRDAGEAVAKNIEERLAPVSKEFEELKSRVANEPLPVDKDIPTQDSSAPQFSPGASSRIADALSTLADREGWSTSPSSDIMSNLSTVMKELPLQKTFKNLNDFISQAASKFNSDFTKRELARAGSMVTKTMREIADDLTVQSLAKDGEEIVKRFSSARSAFKPIADLVNDLNSGLGVRGSVSGFPKNLREMIRTDSEGVLRKLAGTNDSFILEKLQENIPEAAEAIKRYHVEQALAKASKSVKPGEVLNAKKLANVINAMSPEVRALAVPESAQRVVNAAEKIEDQLNKAPHNYSNTARTLDKLTKHLPGTAVGMATLLATGSPLTSGVAAFLAREIGREAPESAKLALLKFLGSSQPIEAGAFKNMVDFIHHTSRGENLLNRAAKDVFKSGVNILPQAVAVKDTERLDKRLKALNEKPQDLLEVGGKTGHYLPDHGQAIAQISANAVNYLNSIRPQTNKNFPLDFQSKPSKSDASTFRKALEIAEQPTLVTQKIKEGSITTQDITHLKNIYPGLYARMQQKLTSSMIDHIKDGNLVPYKTRAGLSMFLGQPLDSSFSPGNIQATQLIYAQKNQSQQQGVQQKPKRGNASLSKIAGSYNTSNQAREMRGLKG